MAGDRQAMRERDWQVVGELDRATGEFFGLDREAVLQTLTDVEAIGDRIGGAFELVPLRAEVFVQDDVLGRRTEYRTVGWAMRWNPYAAALPLPAVQAAVAAGRDGGFVDRAEPAEPELEREQPPVVSEDVAEALRAEAERQRAGIGHRPAAQPAAVEAVEPPADELPPDGAEPDEPTPLDDEVAHPWAAMSGDEPVVVPAAAGEAG